MHRVFGLIEFVIVDADEETLPDNAGPLGWLPVAQVPSLPKLTDIILQRLKEVAAASDADIDQPTAHFVGVTRPDPYSLTHRVAHLAGKG